MKEDFFFIFVKSHLGTPLDSFFFSFFFSFIPTYFVFRFVLCFSLICTFFLFFFLRSCVEYLSFLFFLLSMFLHYSFSFLISYLFSHDYSWTFLYIFFLCNFEITKKVPKIALSPSKNEILHEKPKNVKNEGILIFVGTISNFTNFLNP